MSSLTVTSGVQSGIHFELARRPLSLGREPSRDIQITDPKVSRKHAIIRPSGEGHVIAPIKALNGVIINGTEIADETPLNHGDEIHVGDTFLIYSIDVTADRSNAVFNRKVAARPMRENDTIMA